MSLDFVHACNSRVFALLPEFRRTVCHKLPDTFDETFFKFRFENPFFGYVEVQNDACASFCMLTNNDDLVATHYLWYGKNGYETASTREWIMRGKNATIIFDVGAHTGLFSLLACASNPATQAIVAFEPTARAHSRIQENLIVNAFVPRVKAERLAISNRAAVLEFMHYDDNYQIGTGASYLGTEKAYAITRREICEAVTLDQYIQTSGLVPELVKMDVEGAEIHALQGAHDLIQRRKATFLIEVLPSTIDEVIGLLPGYRLYLIDDEQNVTVSFQRERVTH